MLAKLDARYPEQPRRRLPGLAIAIAALVILVAIGYLILHLTVTLQETGSATVRLGNYCRDKTARQNPRPDCVAWSNTVTQAQPEPVLECHRAYPEDDFIFAGCLLDKNILPPGVTMP